MNVRVRAVPWRTLVRALPLGLLGCSDCTDPWPEPEPPPAAHYLSVVPGEIHIYVPDPTRPERANLIAFVQDEYGRNLEDHSTVFTVTSGAGVSVAPIASKSDSVSLEVAPACDVGNADCMPASADFEITATHAASGLTVSIPVRVRYEATGDHGVAAMPSGAPWPMYGMASGSFASAWQHTAVRPFMRRAGFGKVDHPDVTPPAGDEESGVIFSSRYALWRKSDPWGAAFGDVSVPTNGDAKLSGVSLRVFYAGEKTLLDADKGPFLLALQAGADVVNHTPLGASVTIQGDVTATTASIPWTKTCLDLGVALNTLPAAERAIPGAITVYMLGFSLGSPGAERAIHCGPPAWPLETTGAMADAHAIFVPQGAAQAATIAHEIGHALGLEHVTFWSGFMDDNLMVETDGLSAPMRHRLTLGQVFRAGLDPEGFIVRTLQAPSPSVECTGSTSAMRCPPVAADGSRRVP